MFQRMLYEDNLAAASYLIGCQRTGEAIVIDPLRDVDRYISLARAEGLKIIAVTETHIHADFLSGTRELAEATGARVYLSGEGGEEWSYSWLNQRSNGGSYTHTLLRDGDTFLIGNIEVKVLHTPGHTPEHISFTITDRGAGATEPIGVATGDFVFVGDLGRPDLLESAIGASGAADNSARVLYRSLSKLKQLPSFTQVWPAHGAGSACGKALGAVPTSTVGYELRFNPAIQAAQSEDRFVSYILDGQPEPPLYFARMKRQNKEGPRVLGAIPNPKRIDLEELLSLNTSQLSIIDTRSWDNFRVGHLPGSFFHPLNKSFVTDVGSMLGDDPVIYLVIEENQLDTALRNLIRIGLDKVVGWIHPSAIVEYAAKGGSLNSISEIDVKQARTKVSDQNFTVLDVRRASEYAEAHIPNSIQVAHTRLAGALDKIPRTKPLLVHCRSGVRSARACALLKRNGFDVTNLKGGMLAWQESAQ